NQDYPNLEYIIIDGGSTDSSVEIIRKYESKLFYWTSEPDDGMYFALSKGFEKCTGEIMGWLNSDDLLHQKSLFIVAELFGLKNVNWIQGVPTNFDERGRIVHIGHRMQWSHLALMLDSRFIQQESTFWSKKLWE